MKNAVILYYSCSGNTKVMAQNIKQVLLENKWNVKISGMKSNMKNDFLNECDLLVMGVPVHYWEMPDAALSIIRDLPYFKNTHGFVFSTFGKCVCNSVPYKLAKELQAKGVNVLGGGQIIMPHSARKDKNTRIGDFETSFGKGEPSEENIEKIRLALLDILKEAENGNVNASSFDIRKLRQLHTRGTIANFMDLITTTDARRGSMPHILYDEKRCNLCKACTLICDYQAIECKNERIIFDTNRCRQCYKCIEICKTNSLSTDWEKVMFWTRFVHNFAKNTETRILTGKTGEIH